MQTVRQLLVCDRATIFMVDNQRSMLWSYHPVGHQKIELPITSGIAGHCAATGTIVNIMDAYNDSRFNRSIDADTGYKTTNLLAFPVKRKDEVVAVIQAVNKTVGCFTLQDEILISLMGKQVGIHLSHGLLYERLQNSESRQQILFQVSKDLNINVNMHLSKIFESVTQGAKKIVACDRVSLFLLDQQVGILFSLQTTSTGENETIKVPIGVGVVGRVAETKQALNVSDTQSCSYFDGRTDDRTGYKTKSLLGVPIIDTTDCEENVLGVILVINKNDAEPLLTKRGSESPVTPSWRDHFSSEDVEYLQAFSAFIAITLRNTRLFERDQQRHETLRLLLRVSVMSTRAENYVALIQLFENEIPEVIGCEACSILLKYGEQRGLLYVSQTGDVLEVPIQLPGGIAPAIAMNNCEKYCTAPGVCFKDEPVYVETCDNTAGLVDPQSSLIIQLKLDDNIIGVLQVINKIVKPHEASVYRKPRSDSALTFGPFTPADEAVLKEVAIMASVTLAEQYRRDSSSRPSHGTIPSSVNFLTSPSADSFASLDFFKTPRSADR
eukprot:TRINITY_DN34560_c0_g1_i1.p1 TRINITY_DN34560_c0_g1~~TRINITY_DN34560_c0_g1_i1.p1  ORF type:complete len:553 (+),score=69.32 TRINITY_DN34560_c0_g1_i1:719-2377(+)